LANALRQAWGKTQALAKDPSTKAILWRVAEGGQETFLLFQNLTGNPSIHPVESGPVEDHGGAPSTRGASPAEDTTAAREAAPVEASLAAAVPLELQPLPPVESAEAPRPTLSGTPSTPADAGGPTRTAYLPAQDAFPPLAATLDLARTSHGPRTTPVDDLETARIVPRGDEAEATPDPHRPALQAALVTSAAGLLQGADLALEFMPFDVNTFRSALDSFLKDVMQAESGTGDGRLELGLGPTLATLAVTGLACQVVWERARRPRRPTLAVEPGGNASWPGEGPEPYGEETS
jgi:hypothetical protein